MREYICPSCGFKQPKLNAKPKELFEKYDAKVFFATNAITIPILICPKCFNIFKGD